MQLLFENLFNPEITPAPDKRYCMELKLQPPHLSYECLHGYHWDQESGLYIKLPKLSLYFSLYLRILSFSDPRQWTENHVVHWLQWATKEFSLEGIALHQFRMKGKDICAMGKDAFQARAPAFVGDILWEHLEILQKGRSVGAAGLYGQLPEALTVQNA